MLIVWVQTSSSTQHNQCATSSSNLKYTLCGIDLFVSINQNYNTHTDVQEEGKNKAPIIINNQYICDTDAVLHFSHHGVDYFDNININSRTQRTRSQTQYTKMLLAKLLLSRNTVYILYIMNSFFNYYPPNV